MHINDALNLRPYEVHTMWNTDRRFRRYVRSQLRSFDRTVVGDPTNAVISCPRHLCDFEVTGLTYVLAVNYLLLQRIVKSRRELSKKARTLSTLQLN